MKWSAAIISLLVVGSAAVVIYKYVGHTEGPISQASASSGNGSSRTTSVSTTQSRQYTVLLDVSASRTPAMIAEGERYLDTVIDRMNYSDRLVILQMYEAGVNEARTDLDVSLTKPTDSLALDENEELKTTRNDLKEPVHLFLARAQTGPVMHTDILTTLSIASEKISEGKRNELVILSDMLQSSKEFEFEHLKRMPPPGWIAQRTQQGLVRPLYGACVVAVGVDPSTHEGVVVREFWQKYFEASNATLSTRNYRTTPPSGDASMCE